MIPIEQLNVRNIAVERANGGGLPVVFVHGAGAGSWCWANFMQEFAQAGFDCYAINLRGHYLSSRHAFLGRLSIRDYVADVHALAKRVGPCVLIGHSMGGLVVQKAATRLPVKSVIMMNTAPPRGVRLRQSFSGFGLHQLRMLPAIPLVAFRLPLFVSFGAARKYVLNCIEPVRQKAIFDMLEGESSQAVIEVSRGMVAAPLARLNAPKLVVASTEDHMAPVIMQEQIAEFQKAQLLTLPQHAHLPMLEAGWQKVAHQLMNWLAENGVKADDAMAESIAVAG